MGIDIQTARVNQAVLPAPGMPIEPAAAQDIFTIESTLWNRNQGVSTVSVLGCCEFPLPLFK
jgi:hypothetical protein